MKIQIRVLVFIVVCLSHIAIVADNIDYVNPFIGVDGGGNVLPGPSCPMGLVRINPIVSYPHPTSGYCSGEPIIGFVQTNVSGTGGQSRYGNFMVTPQGETLNLEDLASPILGEEAKVGYYKALLTKDNITAELTCTEKVGVQRFTFNDSSKGYIILSVSSVIKTSYEMSGECVDAYVDINNDGTMSGYVLLKGGWGHTKPYKLYFFASFNRQYKCSGVWSDNSVYDNWKNVRGDNVGAYFEFDTTVEKKVEMRIALSTLDITKAKEHLLSTEGKDFRNIVDDTRMKWENYLSKIDIKSDSNELRTVFYTSLYRTYVMPTDITGENPFWKNEEPAYWDYFCIWDTFRTSYPLITLITPDVMVKLIRSLLDIYSHRGWLPDAWIVGDYGKQQGGTNADVVIADAIVKGLKGFDYDLAYQAIKKNAEIPSDESQIWEGLIYTGKHKDYLKRGFLYSNKACCVSYTLEFAYNDFCTSQVAKALGLDEDATRYYNRSLECYNLFNPETGFFWAKDSLGNWMSDFDENYVGNPWWKGPYFYEGTPWHYSTYVLHDIQGLIRRHGGQENFTQYLDRLFSNNNFTIENEPDIHAPYLYNYAGCPFKTAQVVDRILRTKYAVSRDGLPGNDDSGCMSSWFVFSSMGFYPLAGQDIYLLGKPLFDRTDILLPSGKNFSILGRNLSKDNIYVQAVKLNGQDYDKSYISHSMILEGGILEFYMGNTPSEWGTVWKS